MANPDADVYDLLPLGRESIFVRRPVVEILRKLEARSQAQYEALLLQQSIASWFEDRPPLQAGRPVLSSEADHALAEGYHEHIRRLTSTMEALDSKVMGLVHKDSHLAYEKFTLDQDCKLLVDLTEWYLKKAIKAYRLWQKHYGPEATEEGPIMASLGCCKKDGPHPITECVEPPYTLQALLGERKGRVEPITLPPFPRTPCFSGEGNDYEQFRREYVETMSSRATQEQLLTCLCDSINEKELRERLEGLRGTSNCHTHAWEILDRMYARFTTTASPTDRQATLILRKVRKLPVVRDQDWTSLDTFVRRARLILLPYNNDNYGVTYSLLIINELCSKFKRHAIESFRSWERYKVSVIKAGQKLALLTTFFCWIQEETLLLRRAQEGRQNNEGHAESPSNEVRRRCIDVDFPPALTPCPPEAQRGNMEWRNRPRMPVRGTGRGGRLLRTPVGHVRPAPRRERQVWDPRGSKARSNDRPYFK